MLLGREDMPVVSTQHNADARKVLRLAYVVVKVDALATDLLSSNGEFGDELSCVTALVCPLEGYLVSIHAPGRGATVWCKVAYYGADKQA